MTPSYPSNSNQPPRPNRPCREPAIPPLTGGDWCCDHTGRRYTYDQALELIRGFHGHPAPGLVIGVKMVTLAMAQLPRNVIFDAICETRSCLPDAVQLLTLCTVGNGWLQVADLGRFALSLYDKTDGRGVRVFIDPQKLEAWPTFYGWLYKLKPKKEQDADRLYAEIRAAGEQALSIRKIRVQSRYLGKHSKGAIATCPACGEPYPLSAGSICKGCQGEAPYAAAGGDGETS